MTNPTDPNPIAPIPIDPNPTTRRELRAREERPPRLRLTTRGLILLIAGAAVVVVLAIVAGAVIADRVGAQAAADERRSAQSDAADAEKAFEAASSGATDAVAALTALAAEAASGLAIQGAGLDDAARSPLQEAVDAATTVATDDAEPGQLVEVPDAKVAPGADDRTAAAAFRARADALEANIASEKKRAGRLDDAADTLGEAMTAYLASAATAGAAVLADRGDASDDAKAALQAQLDALPEADATAFTQTLTDYRAAVDGVIASSDEARAPTPGGSGVRVTDPASVTAVVNKRRGLPGSYVPPDLVIPAGVPNNNHQPVRQVLVPDLQAMQAAMAAEGITLRIGSAYRSYDDQYAIYHRFAASEGVAGADTHSARPGNSEHQTGLALDLDDGTGCNLNVCFANRPGGVWLAANSWKYGFILRYGDGWAPIVGYSYEPWHFRYVGVDVATDMHDKGIRTLEEYYGLPAAPDYD
jgi:D-alanyl-D-alanine carboxypeptidase